MLNVPMVCRVGGKENNDCVTDGKGTAFEANFISCFRNSTEYKTSE